MSDQSCFEFYQTIFPNFDREKWDNYQFTSYASCNGECKIVGCLTIIPNYRFPNMDHIWLCGVNPTYRKSGIFKRLIGMYSKHCTEFISIATYADNRWPVIREWIQKRGVLKYTKDDKETYIIHKSMLC